LSAWQATRHISRLKKTPAKQEDFSMNLLRIIQTAKDGLEILITTRDIVNMWMFFSLN